MANFYNENDSHTQILLIYCILTVRKEDFSRSLPWHSASYTTIVDWNEKETHAFLIKSNVSSSKLDQLSFSCPYEAGAKKIWIGPDRITDRIRIRSQIMDRIMLNKRRNFAWQAKIKSAWHSWVQAPPRKFLPKNLTDWITFQKRKKFEK